MLMRPNRLSILAIVPILALALAACGGGSPGTGGGGNNGGGAGASSGSAVAVTPGPIDTSSAEGIAGALVPPDATEVSRNSEGGGLVVAFESKQFVNPLQTYYQDTFPAGTAISVSGTSSTTTGGLTLAFTIEGAAFGASVSVEPSSRGGSGSSVTVTVTAGG